VCSRASDLIFDFSFFFACLFEENNEKTFSSPKVVDEDVELVDEVDAPLDGIGGGEGGGGGGGVEPTDLCDFEGCIGKPGERFDPEPTAADCVDGGGRGGGGGGGGGVGGGGIEPIVEPERVTKSAVDNRAPIIDVVDKVKDELPCIDFELELEPTPDTNLDDGIRESVETTPLPSPVDD
jgi:hypothetical protein